MTILRPRPGDAFSLSIGVRIKAEVFDPARTLAAVEFYVDTNFVGAVTAPPYNLLWSPDTRGGGGTGALTLRAEAVDQHARRTVSSPVPLFWYSGGPPEPVVEIASPSDGDVYASPASVPFTAEVLASSGDTGPIEFFVGTNSVGSIDPGGPLEANTPPVTLTLTNLPEGIYPLGVRYRGIDGSNCECLLKTSTIRVVQVGLRQPSVNPDGGLGFDVVTAFSGKPLLIQSTEDFVSWSNSGALPLTNVFVFGGPPIGTNARRFYRAVALP